MHYDSEEIISQKFDKAIQSILAGDPDNQGLIEELNKIKNSISK